MFAHTPPSPRAVLVNAACGLFEKMHRKSRPSYLWTRRRRAWDISRNHNKRIIMTTTAAATPTKVVTAQHADRDLLGFDGRLVVSNSSNTNSDNNMNTGAGCLSSELYVSLQRQASTGSEGTVSDSNYRNSKDGHHNMHPMRRETTLCTNNGAISPGAASYASASPAAAPYYTSTSPTLFNFNPVAAAWGQGGVDETAAVTPEAQLVSGRPNSANNNNSPKINHHSSVMTTQTSKLANASQHGINFESSSASAAGESIQSDPHVSATTSPLLLHNTLAASEGLQGDAHFSSTTSPLLLQNTLAARAENCAKSFGTVLLSTDTSTTAHHSNPHELHFTSRPAALPRATTYSHAIRENMSSGGSNESLEGGVARYFSCPLFLSSGDLGYGNMGASASAVDFLSSSFLPFPAHGQACSTSERETFWVPAICSPDDIPSVPRRPVSSIMAAGYGKKKDFAAELHYELFRGADEGPVAANELADIIAQLKAID